MDTQEFGRTVKARPAAMCLLLGALISAPICAEVRQFKIQSQNLTFGLYMWAAQAHLCFTATWIPRNQETGAVIGQMDDLEALRRLLSGTGLTFKRGKDIDYKVGCRAYVTIYPEAPPVLSVADFDIPANAAMPGFFEWTRQSKNHVRWDDCILPAATQTNPVKGEMEDFEALRRMVEGTGLGFVNYKDDAAKNGRSPNAYVFDQIIQFEIPRGNAESTLHTFYQQTGIQVLYLTHDAQGKITQKVSGAMPVCFALHDMLAGTGLMHERENSLSALIMPDPGKKIQPPTTEGNDGKLQFATTMTVTGTHIRGVFDLIAPKLIETREDVKSASYATVQDAINVPVNHRGAQNEVSSGPGNLTRGEALNLRGLGSGATLVLVNGRRQPQAGMQGDFVDVSPIPWSMVDRVEVLPDGSSALYGSDAIAGVVNIVLRTKLDGAETQLRTGLAPDGASEIMAAQLFGRYTANSQWLAAYQYSDRSPLSAADRAYTADTDKRPIGGANYSSTRSSPGNILNAMTLAPAFAIPRGQDGATLRPEDLQPGTANLQNGFERFDLLPHRRVHSVYFTGTANVIEWADVFAESRFSRRSVTYHGGANLSEALILVPESNAFFVDPFGGSQFLLMGYNFAHDLGPYVGISNTENITSSLGATAHLPRAWQATLSVSYGREGMKFSALNQLNTNALSGVLAESSRSTAFNPFGDGSYTNPETIAAVRSTQLVKAVSDIESVSLSADGALFTLSAGAIRMAAGVEQRREAFARSIGMDTPGKLQRYDREVTSTYAETSVPIVGNPSNPLKAPRLELLLAGRHENFKDFGSTTAKIDLRWVPWDALKLRASVGSAFKAPTLLNLKDTSQNLIAMIVLPDPLAAGGQSNVIIRQGNNPHLHEETSTTWNAGFDFAPRDLLPGFTASVTAYNINYKNQIIQPGGSAPFQILVDEQQWAAAITRNPSRGQVDALCNNAELITPLDQCLNTLPAAIVDARLKNLAITRVHGVDVSLAYSFASAQNGYFAFNLLGDYVRDFQRAFTATAPSVSILDSAFNPLSRKIHGTAEWRERGPNLPGLSASLAIDYTGDYKNPGSTVRPNVDALATVDFRLAYRTAQGSKAWSGVEISLNAANVFDKAPPFTDSAWGFDYTNAQPYGRVVSFYMQKNWD